MTDAWSVLDSVGARVIVVEDAKAPAVAEVLRSIRAEDLGAAEVVVVALASQPDEVVAAVREQLRADESLAAIASLEPVADAVKELDPARSVSRSLDRSQLRQLGYPVAVRTAALRALLAPEGGCRIGVIGVR